MALFSIIPLAAAGPGANTAGLNGGLKGIVKTERTAESAGRNAYNVEVADPGLSKPDLQLAQGGGWQRLELVESLTDGKLGDVIGIASKGSRAYSKLPAVRKPAKAPELVTGTLLTKDHNYKGVLYSFRISIEETGRGDTLSLKNVYGLDETIDMIVDRTTGAVSIPRQKLYDHSTYGEVSLIPMSIRDGKLYMEQGALEGTLSDDGTITLGTWGVAVTQMDVVDGVATPGQYYGSCFNVFENSEWAPGNASVASYNISANALTMYDILIEQTAANEIMLYGFTSLNTSDVLSARITPDKRIVISSQLIYNNLMYGPFFNYPAKFTQDAASGGWKVSVDSKNPMVLRDNGKYSFKTDGWVISAKAGPGQYIGYAFNDVSLNPDIDIVWPDPVALDFAGEGTAESPYIIKTLSDIQALGQAADGGESFTGVCFKLDNDLDFAGTSPSAYVAIGTNDAPFQGNFDGCGHTLNNFSADGKGFNYTGLFGVIGNEGSVKNLKFTNAKITATGNYMGVVAGMSNGVIDNITVERSIVDCNGEIGGGIIGTAGAGGVSNSSFLGSVTSVGSAAGIIGQSIGAYVKNCNVKANIILDGAQSGLSNKECGGIIGTALRSDIDCCFVSGVLEDKLGYGYIGGIAAYASTSNITNSFNTAAISAKRASFGSAGSANDGDTHTGGLVGYISNTVMTDCYNSGTIVKSDRSEYVGGIVGYLGVGYSSTSGKPMEMVNVSTITNCYSSGQVLSTSTEPHKGIYGGVFVSSSYTGPTPEERCFFNTYFDQQVSGLEHPRYGLTTAQFTAALPEGFSSEVWKQDPGMYPVLKNVGAESQAQSLSSAPLVMREKDNSSKVKVRFQITPAKDVKWELNHDEEAGETPTETKALRMDGNTVTVKDQYANAVVKASTADGWGVKLYSLSIVPKLFDGEGMEDDPYLLKTVADFNNLHDAVANHGQTHENDFFALANDIDFKDSDFHGVGFGKAFEFRGVLDGRNHTVHGLKIDAGVYDESGKATTNSVVYNGLFSIVGDGGAVRNLTIADDCDFMFYSYGGPIAGLSSGIIENCRNYATVNGISSYIGGVVGVNYDNGKVLGCYNAGTVNVGATNAGGITGYNRASGIVSLCQNDGDVLNKVVNSVSVKTKTNTLGGIVGYNYGTIDRTVNNGHVRAYNTVGGIAGYSNHGNGAGNITSSINNALVTALEETINRGGFIGVLSGNCTLTDNYYDSSISVNGAANNNGAKGVTPLSTSELISGEPLANLSADDFDFAANSYPVLKIFAEEEASKAMRSIYVAFAPKQMRTNVLTEVPLAKAEGLVFTLAENTSFKIDGDKITVEKPTGMVVSKDSLTAVLGDKYVKALNISAVPVILKGAGDAESPYLIETPADWNLLADFMDASKWEYSGNHFRIEKDLDFAGDSIRLLAVNGVNFQATLDGANHTVKNYVYENANQIKSRLTGPNRYVGKYLGLIGTLGSTGCVKNMVIDGVMKGHSYIGSIVGDNYGVIENVTNLGTVETVSDGYASGIANRSYENSVIRNCVNEGAVTSKKTYANGIVYETKLGSLIENCTNKGAITSTTTTVSGIAANVAGGVKGCVNEGTLKATSTASGIAYSAKANSWFEDCVNKADIDLVTGLTKAGGNVVGVIQSTTTRKITDADHSGGYIKNCRNEGNLKGGDNVYGILSTLKAGWTMTESSNIGELESTGLCTGLAGTIGEYSGSPEFITVVEKCYNAGTVTGNKAKVSGIAGQLYNYTRLSDSYNLGDVINLNTSGLTTAGLIAQSNGLIERCFNAGKVVSGTNAVGGIVGYISDGKEDYRGRIINCFNIGDVTSDFTGSSTNGNAGGIGGYIAGTSETYPPLIENCYNTGNVTADTRVGGLFAGAFRPWVQVENCYNSGKVTCRKPASDGRYYWSGTTFTNSYNFVSKGDTTFMLLGHKNCYYDKTVNPGSQFRNVPGSAKTTEQLKELALGDAFVTLAHGGYPVLAAFKDHDVANVGSAMLLLSEGSENHGCIKGEITLVAPAGAEWFATDLPDDESGSESAVRREAASNSSKLSVEDGRAIPKAKGNVVLSCLYNGIVKNFPLTIDADFMTGIEESFAGKEIKSVTFIDMQGRQIADPEEGQVYIVRTVYTDGTMQVVKKIATR